MPKDQRLPRKGKNAQLKLLWQEVVEDAAAREELGLSEESRLPRDFVEEEEEIVDAMLAAAASGEKPEKLPVEAGEAPRSRQSSEATEYSRSSRRLKGRASITRLSDQLAMLPKVGRAESKGPSEAVSNAPPIRPVAGHPVIVLEAENERESEIDSPSSGTASGASSGRPAPRSPMSADTSGDNLGALEEEYSLERKAAREDEEEQDAEPDSTAEPTPTDQAEVKVEMQDTTSSQSKSKDQPAPSPSPAPQAKSEEKGGCCVIL